MKLITDPEKNDKLIGFVSDGVAFSFDKRNNPVEVARVEKIDDAKRVIEEWRKSQS